MYFGEQSFIRCVYYKYFLLVCDLSSHSLETLSFAERLLILMKSNLPLISFMHLAFGVVFKKKLPYSKSSRFSPMVIF